MKTFELRFKNKDGVTSTAYLYDPYRDDPSRDDLNVYRDEALKLADELFFFSPPEEIIIVIDGHHIQFRRND